jgi:hypothetical protein
MQIGSRGAAALTVACIAVASRAHAQEVPPPPDLPQPEPTAPATAPPADAPDPTTAATVEQPSVPVDPSVEAPPTDTVGRERPRQLGLNPGAPRLQGGVALGAGGSDLGVALEPGWRFRFHGYLSAPLTVGLGKVEEPAPGQSSIALHTPAQTADTWGSFAFSNVVPAPWVQLNFSYGNERITGTVIVAAYTISGASPWHNVAGQMGINRAFLTLDPPQVGRFRFVAHAGAFGNTYGHMAVYDNGRYETPVMASTNGIGETITAEYRGDAVQLQLEQGFQGHLDLAPDSIRNNAYTGSTPASGQGTSASATLCPTTNTALTDTQRDANANLVGPAYGWPDCNAGSSFVHHLHLGVGMSKLHVTAHWLHAWSADDRTPPLPAVQQDPEPSLPARAQPTGYIDVYGVEARLQGEHLGHLYLGLNHTKLTDSLTVGNVINVLNAGGGSGLARFYLGPASRGNGSITAVGLQYDLSIGKLIRHPAPFWGEGPDLAVSLYGLFARTESVDPVYDGVNRLKAGGEATYTPVSWLGVQGRYDYIAPDLELTALGKNITTARLIAKTEWIAHERIWLQYSHYFNGRGVVDPFTQLPPRDEDLIAFVTSMWW